MIKQAIFLVLFVVLIGSVTIWAILLTLWEVTR